MADKCFVQRTDFLPITGTTCRYGISPNDMPLFRPDRSGSIPDSVDNY